MNTNALTERLPTPAEQEKANAAIAPLSKIMANKGALPLVVREDGTELIIDLPMAVAELVLDVLNHISRGEMVTLVPFGAELTTQKAADLLNVSRPFLVKLLEAGTLKHHMVGSHRRVRAQDLLKYKETRDQERSDGMKKLQRLGQEFDAG